MAGSDYKFECRLRVYIRIARHGLVPASGPRMDVSDQGGHTFRFEFGNIGDDKGENLGEKLHSKRGVCSGSGRSWLPSLTRGMKP